MRRLKTRIGRDGVLRVISQQTRSQAANPGIGGRTVYRVDAGRGQGGADEEEYTGKVGSEASPP